ncbi:hypothetical protein PFLUV_G00090940 [Perca fluviatilis]|uniref:Cyclic AMP-responsive element-binding protein 3-like protein 4 n=1 Tax=Perca fluviatilis TaxID=8168 RepID=A0A6A5FFG0_PERFL|nr:hypothetical protein PFLUV_G00090940 [Perca fluviatilis]
MLLLLLQILTVCCEPCAHWSFSFLLPVQEAALHADKLALWLKTERKQRVEAVRVARPAAAEGPLCDEPADGLKSSERNPSSCQRTAMDAENGELFAAGVAADGWQLDAPFSCSDLVFSGSAKPLQDWVVDPDCQTLNDSESEDVLHGVDPNEVFPSGLPADCSSESDSGISEDPVAESPFTAATATTPQPATVYQVVYDISGLGAVKTEPGLENVISIELDAWSSQMLFPDSCVVNELPVAPPARLDGRLTVGDPPGPDAHLLSPELQLTEEEQKLLTQKKGPRATPFFSPSLGDGPVDEGLLSLWSTDDSPEDYRQRNFRKESASRCRRRRREGSGDAEERILKRVRRKIRNKQSAQDSRRRRKEYIDGLEGRAAACSAQNKELQRTVEQLEKRNMSLLSQLRQLQSLIKQTVSKGAQTSTCLLIILVSLGLIILPSFSPFSRSTSADDDYRPTGVISRNILTDPSSSSSSSSSSSQPTADNADAPAVPPAELGQSEPPDGTAGFDGTAQEGSQSGNGSALVAGETETEPLALGLRAAAGKGSRNPAKPAHADEM